MQSAHHSVGGSGQRDFPVSGDEVVRWVPGEGRAEFFYEISSAVDGSTSRDVSSDITRNSGNPEHAIVVRNGLPKISAAAMALSRLQMLDAERRAIHAQRVSRRPASCHACKTKSAPPKSQGLATDLPHDPEHDIAFRADTSHALMTNEPSRDEHITSAII